LFLRSDVVVRLLQAAVGYGDEVLGHRDTDLHPAIGFVSAMIFVGPPDTRADALARSDDKRLAEIVSSPRDAANPRRIPAYHRDAFVKDFNLIFDSCR